MDLLLFENYLIRKGLGKRTIAQHVIRARLLERELNSFTHSDVDAYLANRLRDGASGSTINKFVQTVHKMCEFEGLDWGEKVQKVREKNKTKVLLSDEEINKFLSLSTDSRMDMFWRCVAYSGARLSEILSLKIDDIDSANKLFLFHETKTGDGRNSPITEPLFVPLNDYVCNIPRGFLFYSRSNGNSPPDYEKHLDYANVLIDFKKRIKLLGITKKVTPYSLRHSFITRLLTDAQAPLFVVQDIVGHKSADTTRRYFHGSVKAMHKAIQQDPLMKKYIDPRKLLSQLVKYIRDFLENDSRFGFTITETDDGVKIEIRVKK